MDIKSVKKAVTTVVTGLFLLLFFWPSFTTAEQSDIRLSFDTLSDWTEKSFKGHTTYSTVQEDGRPVLHAVAVKTASALYKKVSANAAEMPTIKWSWKVKQALPAELPYRKETDDFAGRVMVIFPGTFLWQYRAIAYVWSDKLPVGTVRPSAFTKNIAVIVVESGNQHAGVWRNERRNYSEDYQNFFHAVPSTILGVAVMTDADNTVSEATAWYGDISLTRELEQKNKNGSTP
jgi:Protein of unknown function (DUF3047)